MCKLKCPFCNKKLEPIGTSGQFQCGTWGCDASFNFIATRDVWEYIGRTRMALDVALKCLNGVVKDLPWVKRALDEIAALEQGEHFADISKKIEQKDE